MQPPKSSRPVRVSEMLATAVPGLAERMLEHRIRTGWAATVGDDIARRCRPGALDSGVLQVLADNSPWLHELTLRSDELLARIRAHYGAAVTSLRVSLGSVPPSRSASLPTRTSPCPPLNLDEQRALECMTAGVTDPAVAASLRRLMAKDRLARRDHRTASAARRRNP